jgi:hypothetical protein
MRRRPGLAACAALAAAGCSDSAPPSVGAEATVHLVSEAPDANAAAIATFFRRTCLEAGGDPAALAAALHESGWAYEQVQAPSGAMPIAAWRLDNGELVHSVFSAGPGADFVDCQLALDAEVAPGLTRMRDALRPSLRHPSLRQVSGGPPEVKWQWQPAPRERRDLTIGPATSGAGRTLAARPRLAIHLGSSVVAPPQAPAGTENVQ